MIRYFILILIICLAGCEPPPIDFQPDNIVRPVRLYQVRASNKQHVRTYVARTDAVQTVDISFKVPGSLLHLPIREGQLIKKDDLIASLDSQDLKRFVEQAEIQFKLARQDLERKTALYKLKDLPESQMDQAAATFDLRRLALDNARENLQDATLTSPFDAYVSQRFVDNFINIQVGQSIVRLLDLTEIHVKVNVPEDLLATVRTEQLASVYVQFPFAPGQKFDLTYKENASEAEKVAQTYEVTFAMSRPETVNLLPGMTGTVIIELTEDNRTIAIPLSALLPGDDGTFSVWHYDEVTGLISRKQVNTGPPLGDMVRIISGLTPGERIISAGIFHAHEGMRVRPLDQE